MSLCLTAGDCERIGRVPAERRLAGDGVRWLTAESATDGWALESKGYAIDEHGPDQPQALGPQETAAIAFAPRRPRTVGMPASAAFASELTIIQA